MTRATSPSEQRGFGRRATLMHALARIPNRSPEPCIVRDISDGGARLEFAAGFEPPATFRLVIEPKGIDSMCEVRYRSANVVGVRFLAPDEAVTPTPLPTIAELPDQEPAPRPSAKAESRRPLICVSGSDVRRSLFGRDL
jgi:hypothetical protein